MRYNKFNKNEKEIFIMAILVTGGAGSGFLNITAVIV
jgi:hypothetical protein